MSKAKEIIEVDIKESVMRKVKNDEIRMKPRWIFIVGSLLSIIGIIGSCIVSTIMLSIVFFTVRSRGLMGQWKVQQLMDLFPWWAFIIAIVGMILGIILLKKFDFSYRKNFIGIIVVVLFSFLVSAYALDSLGVPAIVTQHGPMNQMYQQQGTTPSIQQRSGTKNQENGKHIYRQNQ